MIFEVNEKSGTSIPKLFRRKQLTVFVNDFTLITGNTLPHPVLRLFTSHSTYYHFDAHSYIQTTTSVRKRYTSTSMHTIKDIMPLQCTHLKTYFHFSAHKHIFPLQCTQLRYTSTSVHTIKDILPLQCTHLKTYCHFSAHT